MNADSYYEIGHGHLVCEDYAISEQIEDFTFIIVSDGCSQSKNTDVGARLVSIIARDTLIYLYKSGFLNSFRDRKKDSSNIPVVFQELFLKKCLETKAILNLSTDIFDATLLISFVLDDKIYTLGYGDGNIIYKTKEGCKVINNIEYKSGAPFYLSYQMSNAKKQSYLDTFKDYPITNTAIYLDKSHTVTDNVTSNIKLEDIWSFWDVSYLETADLSSITLTSDGLGTYFKNKRYLLEEKAEEEEDISLPEIIKKVTDYKNVNGQFVVRRMSRIKRDMESNHFLHDDDVSCATISFK